MIIEENVGQVESISTDFTNLFFLNTKKAFTDLKAIVPFPL